MGYYPLILDVGRIPVAVIGGGPAAEQKLRALQAAGASVTVWAPVLSGTADALVRAAEAWTWHPAYPSPADLAGTRVVFVATDDPALTRKFAARAEAAGALVNAVDEPGCCDFIAASHFRQGPLLIAVSTGGTAPAVARALKDDLQAVIGSEWQRHIEAVSALRSRLKHQGLPFEARRAAITAYVRIHRPRLGPRP